MKRFFKLALFAALVVMGGGDLAPAPAEAAMSADRRRGVVQVAAEAALAEVGAAERPTSFCLLTYHLGQFKKKV